MTECVCITKDLFPLFGNLKLLTASPEITGKALREENWDLSCIKLFVHRSEGSLMAHYDWHKKSTFVCKWGSYGHWEDYSWPYTQLSINSNLILILMSCWFYYSFDLIRLCLITLSPGRPGKIILWLYRRPDNYTALTWWEHEIMNFAANVIESKIPISWADILAFHPYSGNPSYEHVVQAFSRVGSSLTTVHSHHYHIKEF